MDTGKCQYHKDIEITKQWVLENGLTQAGQIDDISHNETHMRTSICKYLKEIKQFA